MRPFRFLHCADLHLDTPFRGMSGLPPAIRRNLMRSTFDALKTLVGLAVRERVDFMLIAGDVYDAADRSLRAQIRFQQAMQMLSSSGIRVYIVHGNHDPLDGRSARLTWPEGVRIFGAEGPETVEVVCPQRGTLAQIHGISYGTAAVYDNLAAKLSGMPQKPGVYQIGLLHTNVDGDAAHDNYAPCVKRELIGSGIAYWALGHIHTRSVLSGGDGTNDASIVYPGNIQGRSVRECGVKGCYIVDVDEDGGTHLTFHATDAVRFTIEQIDVSGLETEQELKDEIEQRMESMRMQAEGRPVIARLQLEGRGAAHEWLRTGAFSDELMAELRDAETSHLIEDNMEEPGMSSAGVSAAGSETMGGRIAADYETISGKSTAGYETIGGRSKAEKDMAMDMGAAREQVPFVWIESIVDRTGRAVDIEQLRVQQSLVGDMLRMAHEIRTDKILLAAFTSEALAPLLLQSKAEKILIEDLAQDEELKDLLRASEDLLIDALADGGWNG